MKNSALMTSLLSLVLIAYQVSSQPAKVINSDSLLEKPEDSPLERVHVKQETGFDGKVRSIRFTLEIEKDEKDVMGGADGSLKESQGDNVVPEVVTPSAALDTAPSSSRPKRSVSEELTKNTLDDLQAEEAIVFRPLFVYRQQVARRMNLRNGNKPSYSRPRVQRTSLSSDNYYPRDYQLYRNLPYNYNPRYIA